MAEGPVTGCFRQINPGRACLPADALDMCAPMVRLAEVKWGHSDLEPGPARPHFLALAAAGTYCKKPRRKGNEITPQTIDQGNFASARL